jgi:hypothetical protein
MSTYRNIDDFSPKDTYKLVRTIPSTPDDSSITDAWWTVKEDPTDPDSNAMFSLHITPTESDSGQVFNYTDLTAQLSFIVQPTDSTLMDGVATYYYDIQVKLLNDEVYTIETGKLFTTRTVTQS